MRSPIRPLVFGLFLGIVTLLPLAAQEGPLETVQPEGTTPDEIIKKFAAKETEFAKARD